VLAAMRERKQDFLAFGLAQSRAHAAYFRARPPAADEARAATEFAERSLQEQAALERDTDPDSFDAFVNDYRSYTLERFSV